MRIDYGAVFPEARDTLRALDRAVRGSGLEPELVELVKIRASQLNGCAYCLDMHTKDARASGESEQRVNLVTTWREAPCFTTRERAALAWCESLTLLPQSGAPDEVYAAVESCFSPKEVVALTLAVIAINGWNRIAVGLRLPVGDYVPRRH